MTGGGVLNSDRTIGIADGGINAPRLIGDSSAIQIVDNQGDGTYTMNINTLYAYIDYIGTTTLTISDGTRQGQVVNITSNSGTVCTAVTSNIYHLTLTLSLIHI